MDGGDELVTTGTHRGGITTGTAGVGGIRLRVAKASDCFNVVHRLFIASEHFAHLIRMKHDEAAMVSLAFQAAICNLPLLCGRGRAEVRD